MSASRKETPDILADLMSGQNQAIPLSYDYSAMPEPTAHAAKSAARQIKQRMRRAIEDVIFIGGELAEIKGRLPHGHWLPWIETELDLSERSAQNFMRVHREFAGKSAIIADLKPTTAYALLASPNAMAEIEAMPEPPTNEQAKAIIADHKPAPAPAIEGEIVTDDEQWPSDHASEVMADLTANFEATGTHTPNGSYIDRHESTQQPATPPNGATGATTHADTGTPQQPTSTPASQGEDNATVAVNLALEVAEWLREAVRARLFATPNRAAVLAALNQAIAGHRPAPQPEVASNPATGWGIFWNGADQAEYDALGEYYQVDQITRPRVALRRIEEEDTEMRPALWRQYHTLVKAGEVVDA